MARADRYEVHGRRGSEYQCSTTAPERISTSSRKKEAIADARDVASRTAREFEAFAYSVHDTFLPAGDRIVFAIGRGFAEWGGSVREIGPRSGRSTTGLRRDES